MLINKNDSDDNDNTTTTTTTYRPQRHIQLRPVVVLYTA